MAFTSQVLGCFILKDNEETALKKKLPAQVKLFRYDLLQRKSLRTSDMKSAIHASAALMQIYVLKTTMLKL